MNLSHDICVGPIGRVRIGAVMLSIVDMEVGVAHYERVVDFLEGLLAGERVMLYQRTTSRL